MVVINVNNFRLSAELAPVLNSRLIIIITRLAPLEIENSRVRPEEVFNSKSNEI